MSLGRGADACAAGWPSRRGLVGAPVAGLPWASGASCGRLLPQVPVYYVRRHPKRRQLVQSLLKAKTRNEVEAVIEEWYADEFDTKEAQAG